jgi:hypothetical protein
MPAPRFIEMQLSATTLGQLILNRARTQVFCARDPIKLINKDDGIIDHIEFEDVASISLGPDMFSQTVNVAGGSQATIQSRKIRIDLGFRIFLKLISVAQDPDAESDNYFLFSGGLGATLSLDLSMSGSPAVLCVEVADFNLSIDLGDDFKKTRDKVLEQLQSSGAICVPFDPSAITSVLGQFTAQNVVLAAESDGSDEGATVSAIGIRIEVGDDPQTTAGDWSSFVNGFASTLSVDGPDWNVHIDSQLIVDFAVGQFQSGLAGMQDLTIDPATATGSWAVPGDFGGGQIVMGAEGYASPSECPNNIGVTLSATVDLELSGGQLIEHGFVDWDLTDSDVFVCGLTYGGPVGALIGGIVAGPIGAIVGAVIGTVVGVAVAAIIASVFAGDKSLKGNFDQPSCNVIDDHNFQCSTSLALPALDFGAGVRAKLTANNMLGLADGLLLGGTADVVQVGKPFFGMTQPDDEAEMGVIGHCFNWEAGYSFSVELTGSDGPPGGPTTTLCADSFKPWQGIQLLNDPDDIYTYESDASLSTWLPMTLTFNIALPSGGSYFQNPYRPILYVRTSSGSRSVRLPKLIEPSQAELQNLPQQIVNADIGCYKLESGWLGQPGKYNPHWSVDPGPEGDINIWEVVVAVQRPDESISVSTREGIELANGVAMGHLAQLSVAVSGAGGRAGGEAPVVFSHKALAQPHEAHVGSSAERRREPGGRQEKRPSRFFATQRSMRWRSSWSAPGGKLSHLAAARYRGEPCAIISGKGGVEIVSLKNPSRPTLRSFLADARGARPLSGGLLNWGERGLSYDGRRLLAEPVAQVVTLRGHLYALTPREVVVLDRHLSHVGTLPVEGAHRLAAAGGRLIVGHSGGLELFDVSTHGKPSSAHSLKLEGVRGVGLPALSSIAPSVLIEQEGGHFALVSVSGQRPEIVAHYLQRPWFAGTASVEGVTVREAQRGVVDIFVQGKRVTRQF